MADLNFRIAATLDNAGFSQGAAALRGVGTASTEAKGALEGMSAAADMVSGAIGAFMGLQIIQFLKEIVNETVQAETNQVQLRARVEATGASFEANGPKINAFLASMQELTHVSKEELLPAFEMLIDRTHSVRTAQELLTTTIGLARAENIGYAEAATLVAGVMNNTPRALMQVTRMLGLHKAAAADSAAVMKTLQDRFGAMADSVSPLGAQVSDMSNAWKDLKIEFGSSVAPALTLVGDILLRLTTFILSGFRSAFDMAIEVILGGVGMLLKPLTYISSSVRSFYADLKDVQANFSESADAAAQKAYDAALTWGTKDINLKKNVVVETKKAYDQLNDAELQQIAQGAAAAAQGEQVKYLAALAAIDKAGAAKKKALRDQAADQYLSAKDMAALMYSVDQESIAKRQMLWEQFHHNEVKMTADAGQALGALTVNLMAGQEKSWRNGLSAILKMIINSAETAIMAQYMVGAAGEIARYGWAGFASGAALIGAGGAAVSAVAGLVADPSSTPSTPSAPTATSASIASSPVASSPVASAAAAPTQASINVNIYGDTINDNGYIDRLAQRLSQAVNNRDVRLVATSTNTAPPRAA